MYVTASSPLPLYYQLREQIREKIISDEWSYGYEIPSELSLCESLHLSRATVRQAIDDLVNENMLVRMRGKGTYVTYKKASNFLIEPSFIGQAAHLGKQSTTKLVLNRKEALDRKLALELNLSIDMQVTHLKRVRYLDNKPVAIDDNFIFEKFADKLEGVDLEKDSIYAALGYDHCRVGIRPTLIDAGDKQLLNIIAENDMPSYPALGMIVETVSYMGKEPIMLTRRCYRGDFCNLNLEYSFKNNTAELESSTVTIK